MTTHTLLLVDDDTAILTVLSIRLRAAGYAVVTAPDIATALAALTIHPIDLVLSDLRLGREDGLDLMERVHRTDPHLPVLIMTAHGTIPNAVEAVERGAAGYLEKPVDRNALFAGIQRALATRSSRSTAERMLQDIEQTGSFQGIIGRSPPMCRLFDMLARMAPTELTVAVHGESGTGKELVARAVHALSPRRDGELLAINCAALPEHLLQSELFGYRRGAFTGADTDREGLFQKANGGTIFLDEIGDMSQGLQASLLRVLQEREVMPVGMRTPVKVDVRVVVATHRDLAKEVAAGRFRQDLYYRISVASLTLPPLRERGDDISLLAQHFLLTFSRRYGRKEMRLSAAAADAITRHAWPGNVRELVHAMERAVVMADTDTIEAGHIFPVGVSEQPKRPAPPSEEILPMKEARALWERDYLVRLLRSTRGNVSAAARQAGKYRADLYTLLRRHQLDPRSFKPENSDR